MTSVQVFGFFGGTICNKIGHRVTLSVIFHVLLDSSTNLYDYSFIGSLGYGLYMLSLYLSTQTGHKWAQHFIVACGAILGVCAGLLWTAQVNHVFHEDSSSSLMLTLCLQGSIMMAYATEARKGIYIAVGVTFFSLYSTFLSSFSLSLTDFLGCFQPWCCHRRHHPFVGFCK